MKTVCLYFEIHQNIHLKRYRFFDIGTDHYYYDDYENERSITETAEHSYIPALKALIEMAHQYGDYFKCAFSLSGTAIELLEQYSPEVLELLDELNQTGCVEFLAEPYSHGFSSIKCPECFRQEVERVSKKIKSKVLRNSCLMYSDDIGELVADMGFKGMLAEGAKQTLGWKSPHFVYHCCRNPKLKLLLRDPSLSEDISYRFNDHSWSEYPLFAETYADWIAPCGEPLHGALRLGHVPTALQQHPRVFQGTPRTAPSARHHLLHAFRNLRQRQERWSFDGGISHHVGGRRARPLSMARQCDATRSSRQTLLCGRSRAHRWRQAFAPRLGLSPSLISTKASSYGGYRGIYSSPYDAFTNYMNILGDFITRVNNLYPLEIENDELNSLLTTIKNQGDELAIRDKEIAKLKNLIGRLEKQTGASGKSTTTASKKSTTATKKVATTAKKAATTAKKTTVKAKATPKKAEVEVPKADATTPKADAAK